MENIPKKKISDNSYLRYSGIGFQLVATVGLGFFIGYELDKWLKSKAPWFTIGFSTLFLVVGFYFAFKDLLKSDKKD